MIMKPSIIITRINLMPILLFFAFVSGSTSPVSHRKKRYLHFPDKSSFTMTLTLLRQTAVDFPLVNTLHELDFGFRLPQHPEEIFYKRKKKPKHRERRDIHQTMQHVAQLLDPSGSADCCLSQLIHSPPLTSSEEDLLADIINIVFDALKPVVKDSSSCGYENRTCALATQRGDLAELLMDRLHLVHSYYTL